MRVKILILLMALAVAPVFGQNNFKAFYQEANMFFEKYVMPNGVNYSAIYKNPQALNSLYSQLRELKPNLENANNYQAFYINAYNLSVIKTVVDNYPLKSPMAVSGFFDRIKHPIAGEEITLNTLENKRLRGNFDEARIHFVLVCGAISCPPIVNFAYVPSQLNVQLEMQATKALNNPNFIRVKPDEDKVELSEIFKWYKEDFVAKDQSEIDYINQFRESEIPTDYRISYYPYDWTLNNSVVRGARTGPLQEQSVGVDLPAPPSTDINLQTFTAGTLLRKGQMDFTLFNTMYTETANNWQGQVFDGYRATFTTALFQFTLGVSDNARFNLGFDISLRGTGRAANDESFSAVDRSFSFTNTDSTRFGIGVIGPRVKFTPFKGVNNFSIQSSLLFSPNEASEGRSASESQNGLYWIEWDRYVWWNQFFWDKTFAQDKFQVFAEVDLLFRFARVNTQVNHLDVPANLFLSYFPTPKITLYVMSQYVPRFAGSPAFNRQGENITNDAL